MKAGTNVDTLRQYLISNGKTHIDLPQDQIHQLMMLGCLETIRMQARNQASEIFAEIIISNPDPVLVDTSLSHLVELAVDRDEKAIDTLFSLAIHHMNLLSAQAIRRNRFFPKSSGTLQLFNLLHQPDAFRNSQPNLYLLAKDFISSPLDLKSRIKSAAGKFGLGKWIDIIEKIDVFDQSNEAFLLGLFPSLTSQEQSVLISILSDLVESGNTFASDLLCKIFIFHEHTEAKTTAIKLQCLPETPLWIAIYFFLSSQWDQYKNIDPESKFISTAYQTGSREFRTKLLSHSRQNGQTSWMKGIANAFTLKWLEDLSDADWEHTIKSLEDLRNYPDLWRLAQYAPPIWSVKIMVRLHQNQWEPEELREIEHYHRLLHLSTECILHPFILHPSQTFGDLPPKINCISLDPQSRRIAAGSETGEITVWDLLDDEILAPRTYFSPAPNIRCLSFDHSGEYLVSAAGDHKIRLYRLKDGQIIKTLEGHSGMIRSVIIPPDPRHMISASIDGTIRYWQFPYGTQEKILRKEETELFCAIPGEKHSTLITGGVEPEIEVWGIPSQMMLRRLSGHENSVLSLAYPYSGELVASASRDKTIRVWNYFTGAEIQVINNLPESIYHLGFHPSGRFILGSGQSGKIYVWSAIRSSLIDQLQVNKSACVGINMRSDGFGFFSGNADGKIMYWDLKGYTIMYMPISYSLRLGKESILQRLEDHHLSPSEKTWLKFSSALIEKYQQFDIQLGESITIHAGEFDIEL